MVSYPQAPVRSTPEARSVVAGSAPSRLRARPGLWYDAGAVILFALIAFWVTKGLWLNPGSGVANNPADQAFFEWAIAHGARVVSHGVNPFHSPQMGVPTGVNMMANTSVLGVSIPLSPITLLFGPRLSFNLGIGLGLMLTATSWYFVLARALLHSRAAALVGGLFCGFAPGLIAHANAHVNIVAQAVVPLLIWRTLRLAEPGRWLRNGLWLALAAIVQFFVNPEMLLMVSVATALFVLVLALDRDVRDRWRSFVAGLLVAAGVTLVVLAYPLWVLLFGPGAYTSVPPGYQTFGADILAYIAFGGQSIAGSAGLASHLAQNPTEENAFFGLPLIVLAIVLAVLLRRRRHVAGLALAGLVAAVLSLGPDLIVYGHYYNVPMPGRFVASLPLFTSIVPTRWALIVTIVIGMLLAVAVTELRGRTQKARVVGGLAIAAALIPLAPKPLPTFTLPQPPAFLRNHGAWRTYAAGGHSLMFLPMASNIDYDPIRWSAETLNQMPITQGYFLTAGPDGAAIDSAPSRFLSVYVQQMPDIEGVPEVSPDARRTAYADLRYWRVGAVVLLPQDAAEYRGPMSALLGFAPKRVGGVEIWDVRGLTGPPGHRTARP